LYSGTGRSSSEIGVCAGGVKGLAIAGEFGSLGKLMSAEDDMVTVWGDGFLDLLY
jgi:hypothetical protein